MTLKNHFNVLLSQANPEIVQIKTLIMENTSNDRLSGEKRFEKLVSSTMGSSTVKRKIFFGSQPNKSSSDQPPKAKRQRLLEKVIKKYKNCFAASRKLILPDRKIQPKNRNKNHADKQNTDKNQVENKFPSQILLDDLNVSEDSGDEVVHSVKSTSTKQCNHKTTSSKEAPVRNMLEPSKKIKQELLDEQIKKNVSSRTKGLTESLKSQQAPIIAHSSLVAQPKDLSSIQVERQKPQNRFSNHMLLMEDLNLSEDSSDEEDQAQQPKTNFNSPKKFILSAVAKKEIENRKIRSPKQSKINTKSLNLSIDKVERKMEKPSRKIKQELLEKEMEKENLSNNSQKDRKLIESLQSQQEKSIFIAPLKNLPIQGQSKKMENNLSLQMLLLDDLNISDSDDDEGQIVKSPPAQQEKINRVSSAKGKISEKIKVTVENKKERSVKVSNEDKIDIVDASIRAGPTTSTPKNFILKKQQATQEKSEKCTDFYNFLSKNFSEDDIVKMFEERVSNWEERRKWILEKTGRKNNVIDTSDAPHFETCNDVYNYWMKKVSKGGKCDIDDKKSKDTEDNHFELYFEWRLNRDKCDVLLTPGKWHSNRKIDETKLDKDYSKMFNSDIYVSSSDEESGDEKYAALPMTPGKYIV